MGQNFVYFEKLFKDKIDVILLTEFVFLAMSESHVDRKMKPGEYKTVFVKSSHNWTGVPRLGLVRDIVENALTFPKIIRGIKDEKFPITKMYGLSLREYEYSKNIFTTLPVQEGLILASLKKIGSSYNSIFKELNRTQYGGKIGFFHKRKMDNLVNKYKKIKEDIEVNFWIVEHLHPSR